MSAPTHRQLEYVAALKARCHLSDAWLDEYCIANYGAIAAQMDVQTCSALLDEMQGWADHPANLLRAQGQQPLFEVRV